MLPSGAKVSFLLALVLWLALPSHALPSYHSYRGVSRYASVTEDTEADVPRFPNPRDDPDFYAHRYTETYIQQGFEPERPRWAETILATMRTLFSGIALDLSSLARLTSSPWAFTYEDVYRDLTRFRFNPSGDEGFLELEDGVGRHELEQNATIEANLKLPADSGFDYANDKVRGVNIGNWLIFELWMDSKLSAELNNHAVNAPHKNAIVDEWTAGLYSKPSWASHVLQRHFDTWITEQDFIDIKNAGLNHVRIPFPYWAFEQAKGKKSPYLTLNRYQKLLEACGWAKKHGLKVWVDLHAVPGSQNGYDNSGRKGPIHWPNDPDYYKKTQYAYTRLTTLFSKPEWQGVVTAVEAINEPLATNSEPVKELIRKYYPWARDNAAKPTGKGESTSLLMVMHDGFLGPKYWKGFFTGKAAKRVLLDTHQYFIYSSKEKQMKDSERLKEVCSKESLFTDSQKNYPTIAGEFSVNGPNGDHPDDRDLSNGPVHFPDGPKYPYSKKYMAFMARNFATQTATFEKGSGWHFWAWKNRNDMDWSYKAGLQYGWIPKNLDDGDSPFGDDPCADFR